MDKKRSMLALLNQFYEDEAAGLPHYNDDICILAWELAETIKVWGVDNWKEFYTTPERLEYALRTKPDAAHIDTAVNLLHWAVLAQCNCDPDDFQLFNSLGKNIMEWILTRGVSRCKDEVVSKNSPTLPACR